MIEIASINKDLVYALGLFGFAAVIAFVYALRIVMKGRAHFDRVEKQGGSLLLRKEVMEGAYWFLQPFGRLLVSLRVTPNQISWGSLILGILAGACLAFGHFGTAAVLATISAL